MGRTLFYLYAGDYDHWLGIDIELIDYKKLADVYKWKNERKLETLFMVYDDNKGFGFFKRDELKKADIENSNDWLENPEIIWIGQRIPDYSTSFDVEPASDNIKSEFIDIDIYDYVLKEHEHFDEDE